MSDRLKSELNSYENCHSPFEQELRRQPLLACDAFLTDNAVGPAAFSVGSPMSQTVDSAVADVFPVLTEKGQSSTLVPNGALTGVSGKRIAVLFSGGPASGGNNVIVGIKHALGRQNTLFGVKAGPKGLLQGDLFEISDVHIDQIKNLGGFDFLGSDRTKIKTDDQFSQVEQTVKQYQLDGIVVIGGDDSNTNAAFLAERLAPLGCQVIGVPKTIDGDLQVGALLPISFGFDTATKTYAELVGNILQDTPSSRKYWHFVKLMGRSASHVALEVGLQTRPTITLISEEVQANKWSVQKIVRYIAETVVYRFCKGMAYGVVLIPEGLIEFIPEFRALIQTLEAFSVDHQDQLAPLPVSDKLQYVSNTIDKASKPVWDALPVDIQEMVLLVRDSHGNLPVSQIPTESLLIDMTAAEIQRIKQAGTVAFENKSYQLSSDELALVGKVDFKSNTHFFGYEGRCGAPTQFDAAFTYNLGLTAGSLILDGKTGYMAGLTQIDESARPVGIPLLPLINVEIRHGKESYVIEKALVQLESPAFQYFSDCRDRWAKSDVFVSPGPRQLWGPTARQIPILVALNQAYSNLKFDIGVRVEA